MNRLRAGLPAAAFVLTLARTSAAQSVALDTGFLPDPHYFTGASGGPIAAHGLNQRCTGYISGRPNHVIDTRTGFRFLRTYVESTADTTLIVRGPTGTDCADDTYGLNPGIDLENAPPGRYEFYVGSYAAGSSSGYQMSITESRDSVPGMHAGVIPQPPPPAVDQNNNNNNNNNGNNNGPPSPLRANLAPTFGRISLPGAVTTSHYSTGRTEGALDATGVNGQGACHGFVTAAPSYVLNLGAAQAFLRAFVTSASDTTLIIQFPDGRFFCNDDSYNTLHPSIEGAFAAGTYYIWVGIYRAGQRHPFRLAITSDQNEHPAPNH